MTACLCIHGFTGSPNEVMPLVKFIEQNTDWEVSIPTLPGHGENLQLKGISYHEWLVYAEKELEKLLNTHEKVYVIGFSMGGLIASYLTTQYPVDKLILLSAAAYYINPRQLGKDITKIVLDLVKGKQSENELYIRYTNKIKNTPLAAAIQFRKLVRYVRPKLPEVQIPTFIAQGDSDGIVPLKSAAYLYNTIRAEQKRIIYVKDSKHLICHSDSSQHLFEEILAFLKV
ncbi:MAG TPA: alpha/beta fold hydrolase [Niallia sp.]|nr:alpha/beta fold hydrolase [Niallia sp.]